MPIVSAGDAMESFLENKKIETKDSGRPRLVPALDPGWAEDRHFISYHAPPLISVSAEKSLLVSQQELWLERTQLFRDDLEYLLRLPHYRFWSQIVFHTALNSCLDSYLKNAVRTHDPQCYAWTDVMKRAQQDVHRLVFFVYVRMSVPEESETSRLSASMFGELIYNNYLFDIPKLMDLCTLYARENKLAMEKLITTVFDNQPSYEQDLRHAVETLIATLTSIEAKFGLNSGVDGENPPKITEFVPPVSCSDLSWKDLLDTTFYLVDTWVTLHNFLDVSPKTAPVFLKADFVTRIATFYERLVPPFVEEFRVRALQDNVKSTLDEAKKRLSFARVCMLKVFRGILESACIHPILENGASKSSIMCAEEFLEVLTSVLSEKTFLLDYIRRYPFGEDIELLTQAQVELDMSRVQYIEAGIAAVEVEQSRVKHSENVFQSQEVAVNGSSSYNAKSKASSSWYERSLKTDDLEDVGIASGIDSATFDVADSDGACAGPRISGDKLLSLISHVKDILADLGDGFIEMCLEYYNYDCESVIHALLEGSLPGCLDKLDRQLPRVIKQNVAVKEDSSVLSERRNIFDNDEFDVFTHDEVDRSRIHRGKKIENRPQLPKNDSALKDATINLALKYDRNKFGDLIYDDEYDDTYDGNMIGTAEVTNFDELMERRPFVVPRILEVRDEDGEDYEEPAPEPVQTRTGTNDFCENPEIARERYAQRRQQRDKNPGNRSRDYQGKAKGQGQDEAVLKNRANKEKNKAYHGNHNRRSGSDYKRSRGMIPS